MNKRGFTLIEVLVTVSILILIISISVPSIISLNTNQNKKQQGRLYDSIENAAQVYVTNHGEIAEFPSYIKLDDLVAANLIADKIIDPITNKKISTNSLIKVEKIDNVLKFTYPYINTPPLITLSADFSVKQGTVINLDNYVTITDADTPQLDIIKTHSTIDTSVLGEHSIEYTADDGFNEIVRATLKITVTPAYIYYADASGNLRKRMSNGTNDSLIVSSVNSTNTLTTDNGWVYYTSAPGGYYGGINCNASIPACVPDKLYLVRKKTDGSTAAENVLEIGYIDFYSGQDHDGNSYYTQLPTGIALVGEYIYYTDTSNNLRKRKTDGTGDSAVVSAVKGTNILITPDGWVYYTSIPGGHYGGINCNSSIPACVPDKMYLVKKKLDGSTIAENVLEMGYVDYFSGQDHDGNSYYSQLPAGIALDDVYIYYTDTSGNLRKRKTDGTGDSAVVSAVKGTNILITPDGWVYYTSIPGGHYGGINCNSSIPACVSDKLYLIRKKLDGSTVAENVLEIANLDFFSGQDHDGNSYYSQIPSYIIYK